MAASIAQFFSQLPCWTSDAVLLERYVQNRDEAAFATLVSRHGALVLRLCRRILGDAHAAEDAFQATFLILARRAYSLKQPDALPAWLYGVARRVALKARRQSSRRAAPLDETLPDPLTQLNARELLDILDEEVQRLPAAQRSAFVLCCLEGHTQEQAARMLGWTPGSVKGHLERGRQRLQSRLQRRGIALSAMLALVAVSRSEATSALLLQSTVKAALHGGISSSAALLANGVLKTMLWGKLAGVVAVILTIALAASSTVALVYPGSTTEAPEESREVRQLTCPAYEVIPGEFLRFTDVAFTQDGRNVITSGPDPFVRIWDTDSGKELRRLTVEGIPGSLALSRDGKKVAVVMMQGAAANVAVSPDIAVKSPPCLSLPMDADCSLVATIRRRSSGALSSIVLGDRIRPQNSKRCGPILPAKMRPAPTKRFNAWRLHHLTRSLLSVNACFQLSLWTKSD